MPLEASIQPRRTNQQLWCGIPDAELAQSSGDAWLLQNSHPLGSVRRLLCQPNRWARMRAIDPNRKWRVHRNSRG
jgi:hypothetical protein